MCVLILKLALESLHLSSIHKPHMDPPLSLHVCSFHKPHMDQQVVTACVFFPQTTYGSTSGHCMCVLFHKPHMDPRVVIACVFFPQTTYGSTESLHVCSFHKPHMDPLDSLHV